MDQTPTNIDLTKTDSDKPNASDQPTPLPDISEPLPENFDFNQPPIEPLPEGTVSPSLGTPTVTQSDTPMVSSVEETKPPSNMGRLIKGILTAVILVIILTVIGFIAVKLLPSFRLTTVTLTYWGLWESEQIMAPVIADFEKTHPKIKINYLKKSPKQYRETLASSLARGEGPDIFRYHNTWLPMFSRDLAPVPAKVKNSLNFSTNFYPIVNSDLKRGNDYFGIPLEFDGLGLYINNDIFQAAGAVPPTTWEELRATATKLTVKDQDGKIRTAGVALGKTSNIEHWSDILGLMMLQNGVDLTNPTGNLAEDALIYFNLFSRAPDNTWDETLDNSILSFAKGQVAMILAPSWEVFEIKNINSNLNFKVVPVPQLPGSNIAWASYWAEGVWQKSKYSAEAFEFLQYLASKEVITKLYSEEAKVRLFGEPYSRVDLGQTIINDAYAGAYVSQAPNARSFYLASRTFDNGINDKIIKYFEDAVNSLDLGVSPTAALETASKGVNQVLSTYNLAVPQSAPTP